MGRLGDDFVRLFQDLADHDTVDLQRLGDFSRRLNGIEQAESLVRGWSQPGSVDPFFGTVYADWGKFRQLPMEMARIGTNTAQTISTGTTTILKPADAITAAGRTFTHGLEINPTNGSINLGTFDSPAIFLLVAWVQWDNDDTGDRILYLYDSDAGTENARLDHRNAAAFTISNGVFLWRNAGSGGDNLELRVYQDSGGDLDANFWRFSAVRLH